MNIGILKRDIVCFRKIVKLLFFSALFAFPFASNAQDQYNICVQSDTFHIVILGSSTAAGSGPSSADSAWVNRYRKYVQSINPANSVTNLAVGGTTTYHIMPDWFVPPAGKPNPNPAKNVSQAIALGADAIIINMPSNDAGNGFGLNEQMSNFITISNVADSVGIPVWVCTTQPRNNYSSTQIQIQTSVRDSILAYFGSMAIDFWTGFSTATNGLSSTYDSGDGVHMNDLAHGILNQRVIGENILSFITDTLPNPEHYIASFYYESSLECGDSSGQIVTVVANRGVEAFSLIDMNIEIVDNIGATTNTYNTLFTSVLPACSADTIYKTINTYQQSDFTARVFVNSLDANPSNDTSSVLDIITSGYPMLSGLEDTVCYGDLTSITVFPFNSDTIFWYDSFTSLTPIASGPNFNFGPLYEDSTVYAQSSKGSLTYIDNLFTTSTSTTNYNGIMFDIIANEALTIDSLELKVNSTGNQNVIIYRKSGSFSGSENTPGNWIGWDTVSVNVPYAGAFVVLDVADLGLAVDDTIGIYMHLQNSGSQLSYLNDGNTGNYSNPQIQVISGSGIAYTFGTIYNPRKWNGVVHYHYGFNPLGDCSSDRVAVTATVSNQPFDLGNDTMIYDTTSILLSAGGGYAQYNWSTGEITPQILVDSNNFPTGTYNIWVEAISSNGCIFSDTIELTVLEDSSNQVEENTALLVSVFPNPSDGQFQITSNKPYTFAIYSIRGRLIQTDKISSKTFVLDLSAEEAGIYNLVLFEEDGYPSTYKLMKH